MVVFVRDADEAINVNMDDQFFTVKLCAINAKDARRKAWKEVNLNRGLLFIKRDGWRIFTARPSSAPWPAGPWRAPGIYIP